MRLLALMAMLFSFPAFAGDSYFICFTNGEYSYDIINTYIGDGGIIEDSYYDIPDDYYTFEFNTETFQLKATHGDVHTGNVYKFVNTKLDYYEEVKISERVSCMLAEIFWRTLLCAAVLFQL
jgi:hypothetical protein